MDHILQACRGTNCCPVAVLERNGQILIGLRHYQPHKWSNEKGQGVSVWTVPGGRCDANENVEQALRREVEEEVGITDFKIEKFLGEVPGAKTGDLVPIFFCKTNQDFILKEPKKFSEWRWATKTDIPKNFINEHARTLIEQLPL